MDPLYYYLIAVIIIIIIIVIAYFYFFKSSSEVSEVADSTIVPAVINVPIAYTSGRYVRLRLEGDQKQIGLGEVEVMSNGINVALNKTASMSSTYANIPTLSADKAVDGRKTGVLSTRDIAVSIRSTNPWWEVDLGDTYPIDSIKITNRMESQYWAGLSGLIIEILDVNRNIVSTKTLTTPQFENEITYK